MVKFWIFLYLFIGIILMAYNVYIITYKNNGLFDEKDKTINYNNMPPKMQFLVQGIMILLWGPLVFANILSFLYLNLKLIIAYIKNIYYNVVIWFATKMIRKQNKKDELIENILKEKHIL